jgi:hypothetical protein
MLSDSASCASFYSSIMDCFSMLSWVTDWLLGEQMEHRMSLNFLLERRDSFSSEPSSSMSMGDILEFLEFYELVELGWR